MADRGILFSAPMVAAIIDGRKTQTRRLIKPAPFIDQSGNFCAPDSKGVVWNWGQNIDGTPCLRTFIKRVGFAVGDRLYVREGYFQRGNWQPVEGRLTKGGRQKWAFVPADDVIMFDAPGEFRKGRHNADPETIAWHQRLGRFMPRAYSRLTLLVSEVRIQQLKECSRGDAIAEGIQGRRVDGMDGWRNYSDLGNLSHWSNPVDSYSTLWNSLHTQPGEIWADNPFVVAVTFNVDQRNIDAEVA